MFFKEELIFPSCGRSNYRIPTMVSTCDGTVLAFCNDRKDTSDDSAKEVSLVYKVKKVGKEWSELRVLTGVEGWDCWMGTSVYDAEKDTVIVFGGRNPVSTDEYTIYTDEEKAEFVRRRDEEKKRRGLNIGGIMWKSTDGGESFFEESFDNAIGDVEYTHYDGRKLRTGGNTHGAAHGIQLKYGDKKGRLVCPSRFGVDSYKNVNEIRFNTYNNCIFSDDHGKTWTASLPVQMGTGEGAIIENADGSLTYNSRAYFADGKRRIAKSYDGGESWCEFGIDEYLCEETYIGCNASFIRVELDELDPEIKLPEGAKDVTVFVNPFGAGRNDMTVSVSFDSGKTWAFSRSIHKEACSYSSLVYSPVDKHFHLIYEKGKGTAHHVKFGITAVEFDLEWLLA